MRTKEICQSLLSHDFIYVPKAFLSSVYQNSVRSSPRGVSFQYVVNKFPSGNNSNFTLNIQGKDTHCKKHDGFGDNDCHFDWSEEAVGMYSVAMPRLLDESARIKAKVVLENHVSHSFDCALCGQPCDVGLPLIHFDYQFQMPPCPVDLRNYTQEFKYSLWKHSPTEGFVTIPLEANVEVYSSPGNLLAEFEVSGTIR
jgi:hypothetical protein